MKVPESLYDLTNAETAFMRVQGKLERLGPDELRPQNVELVSATSLVLGVSDRVLQFRDRAKHLPEFDASCFDNLVDYALSTWYVHVTNLPQADPPEAAAWIKEVVDLRSKLLLWAEPLAASGQFEQAAVDQIKEGQGHKDAASDVVALVGLYRAVWDKVQTMCGVTEADLIRAADLGPKVFALVGHRENRLRSRPDSSLRVHRTWSLLDNAYEQCRRAIQFFRFDQRDADVIAPSLRSNPGVPTAKAPKAEPPAAQFPSPEATAATEVTSQVPAGPNLGGAGGPFTQNQG